MVLKIFLTQALVIIPFSSQTLKILSGENNSKLGIQFVGSGDTFEAS